MKNKMDYKIWMITGAVCLLPVVIGLCLYPYLPEQIAVHFNYHNEPDVFCPKPIAVFLLPFAVLLLQSICCILSDLQMSESDKNVNRKVLTVCKWILPVLSLAVILFMDLYALGYPLDARVIICTVLGILFIISGNYLPKSKITKYKFIPGTRGDKEQKELVYKKSAKMMGYLLIFMGILFLISLFFEPIYSVCVIILFIVLFLSAAVVYPLILAKKLRGNR